MTSLPTLVRVIGGAARFVRSGHTQREPARMIAHGRIVETPIMDQTSRPGPFNGSPALHAAAMLLILALPACQHEPPIQPLITDTGGTGGGGGGGQSSDPCDPDSVYFLNTIQPLLTAYCAQPGCHDAGTMEEGFGAFDYSHIMEEVSPGDPGGSDLWDVIQDGEMPPSDEAQLTSAQELAIYTWIAQGAQNNGCEQCDTLNVTYAGTIQPLLANKCNGCHGGSTPSGGLDLTQFAVVNTIALDGRFAGSIQHQAPYENMPPSGGMLPPCEIDQVLLWIDAGAPNN